MDKIDYPRLTRLRILAITVIMVVSTGWTAAALAAGDVIKVGVSTNSAPLIYKQNGKVTGLEAEFAHELGKFTGKSIQFVEVKWTNQIPALLDKRTDIIMSGMSITKLRQMRIAFSDPYFRSGQMALTKKSDTYRFPPGYYGLLGASLVLRIGAVRGTTGEEFVRENFGSARQIKAFNTARGAVDKLVVNNIDLLIHDAPMIMALAAEYADRELMIVPSLLTEEYLAWGVRKDNPELLDAANRFLAELKAQNKLFPIVERWIPFNE